MTCGIGDTCKSPRVSKGDMLNVELISVGASDVLNGEHIALAYARAFAPVAAIAKCG